MPPSITGLGQSKKRHRKEREENLELTKGGKNKGRRKFETTVRYKSGETRDLKGKMPHT